MTSKIFFDNALYAEGFLQYLLEHLEEAERIPDDAVIMFSAEGFDCGSSLRTRLVVSTPEPYRGRTVIRVGVRETGEPQRPYEFLFPWTESNVWVRLDPAPWIQESLTAASVAQIEKPTRYYLERPIYHAPTYSGKAGSGLGSVI